MPLVNSLLTAIVRIDGDALVLHAGERPYVVAPSGQSELSPRVLTLEAMTGMLGELLSEEARRTLDEVGAVQHNLPASPVWQGERYTVVAARGGEDIWIEIRRHRKRVEPVAPVTVEPVVPPPSVEPLPTIELSPAMEMSPAIGAPPAMEMPPVIEPTLTIEPDVHEINLDGAGSTEDAGSVEPDPTYALEPDPASAVEPDPASAVEPDPAYALEPDPAYTFEPDPAHAFEPDPAYALEPDPASAVAPDPAHAFKPDPAYAFEPVPASAVEPDPTHVREHVQDYVITSKPIRRAGPLDQPEAPRAVSPPHAPEARVLPLARHQARSEQPIRFSQPLHTAGIDRLLRIAVARGASTLYLTSQARPSIRIDGEISPIEGEAVLGEPDVEALMLDIIPERNREALRSEAGVEWICDVPDVGRIRCVTFRDHRGAGGIFRMIPARAISAEQLGLSREIQGLCAEADGLVLVTGPRSSGKSTLISAFVDLINRTRSDHVITLEHQIKFVHENRGSLVSQREVRGDNHEWMAVVRAALRENPDVLVIEDFRSPEIVTLALEAAQSGHLVIGALTAHTATAAIDRIIDQTTPDRRPKVQLDLAEALRGIVAQVLLRKTGGGRVAAREVLLNTSAVVNLIAEGKTSQLPMAIDSGRKHGMVPLNDALVAFVEGGIVDSREAYRQAADQQGFLAALKRQGVDTSFVERLA